MRSVGWRVHGWAYPVVWWARRKPRSRVRQWMWSVTDAIAWRQTMRYRRKLRRMSDAELRAHVKKRWSKERG